MRFEKRFFGVLVLMLGALFVGCTPPDDPVLDMIESDLNKTKVDDLSRTMDFVSSEIRFDQKEFKNNVSSGLNRWVSYSTDKLNRIQWNEDEISQPLFDANATLQMLQRNDEYSFLNTDGYYLQQSAWIGEIADRVVASDYLGPFELYRLAVETESEDEDVESAGEDVERADDDDADPSLSEILNVLNPGLNEQESNDLATSLKLFDWVVRNIQLLPAPDFSEEEAEELRLNNNASDAATAGLPGLGYQRYPWQVLTYGRGDYVDRAKLMMLMLRHLEMDSVMLATVSEDGEATPWVVGVPIGDDYFLFDTKMALPIPGKKIGSIATLADVRTDSELITSLDLTTEESLEENTQYWVKPDQLKQLDALIYVSPESVSKRMLALESSLIGDARLTLAFTADEIAASLPDVEGVEEKAWDVAFETHKFRQAVREALEQTTNNVLIDKLAWHYLDEAYVDNFVVYRTARARFFKGKFKTEAESIFRNAVESFQRLMYTDTEIDNLGSDKKLQRRLGIRKEATQNAQSFLQEVQSVQRQMRLVRRDAGFFLSQCLFDNGSANAAANWLLRLNDEEDADRWSEGVTYLLGRAYEASKEYDEAIDALSKPKVDQAHGNLIRVRMLKELISRL